MQEGLEKRIITPETQPQAPQESESKLPAGQTQENQARLSEKTKHIAGIESVPAIPESGVLSASEMPQAAELGEPAKNLKKLLESMDPSAIMENEEDNSVLINKMYGRTQDE